MTDDPEGKIVRLMRLGTTLDGPAKSGHTITVNGNGNVVAGGDIFMGPPPRPKVTPRTGDGTIDARQKAELMRLVKAWVDLNNAVRRKALTMQGAWSGLNRAMKVNSYHELTPAQFDAARKWLTTQRGRVLSMKSAPEMAHDFRADAIRAIKARGAQLGDQRIYAAYIRKSFNANSLTDLTDEQLQLVRKWIMRKK